MASYAYWKRQAEKAMPSVMERTRRGRADLEAIKEAIKRPERAVGLDEPDPYSRGGDGDDDGTDDYEDGDDGGGDDDDDDYIDDAAGGNAGGGGGGGGGGDGGASGDVDGTA
jgi:hypothetical protein